MPDKAEQYCENLRPCPLHIVHLSLCLASMPSHPQCRTRLSSTARTCAPSSLQSFMFILHHHSPHILNAGQGGAVLREPAPQWPHLHHRARRRRRQQRRPRSQLTAWQPVPAAAGRLTSAARHATTVAPCSGQLKHRSPGQPQQQGLPAARPHPARRNAAALKNSAPLCLRAHRGRPCLNLSNHFFLLSLPSQAAPTAFNVSRPSRHVPTTSPQLLPLYPTAAAASRAAGVQPPSLLPPPG